MDKLAQSIIAILFVSAEPIKIDSLADFLSADSTKINSAINLANDNLQDCGLHIISDGTVVQLATQPEQADTVSQYLKGTPLNLSASNTEVLSIIAYKQPVGKDTIDEIRGIASDQALRSLLDLGLIQAKKTKTKPTQYSTTIKFLRATGLASIADLPAMEVPHD